LYIANGGDGSLRAFQTENLTLSARIELADDADNVRIDAQHQRIYVGYGNGALAVIDERTNQKLADIQLKAHPESFQLEHSGPRIFVNVPDAGEIAVVDRRTNKQIASWPTKDLRSAYPLALDETNGHVVVVFRRPAVLAIFDMNSGREIARITTCGDADDVFIDSKRGLIYVSCGEGFIDVLTTGSGGLERRTRATTVKGARTSLFSPDTGRLYVAARAANEPAAIWIFRVPE
jgi:DNA-binding beta-propeller fold protein YncE